MKNTILILLILLSITTIKSQNCLHTEKEKICQTIGISFGAILVNDRTLFLDESLSKVPNRPFFQIGVGFQAKNIVVSTTVVLDLWYINSTVYVPLFNLSKHKKSKSW